MIFLKISLTCLAISFIVRAWIEIEPSGTKKEKALSLIFVVMVLITLQSFVAGIWLI